MALATRGFGCSTAVWVPPSDSVVSDGWALSATLFVAAIQDNSGGGSLVELGVGVGVGVDIVEVFGSGVGVGGVV
jgi:hypothetical protein